MRRGGPIEAGGAWIILAMLGAPVGAQLLPQQAPPRKVEQGIGDVGPGSTSLRNLQVDLRVPTGFESVYELQRTNPFAPPGQQTTTLYMRADGGVSAVFPRSIYAQGGGGLVPQIPPDTIFYIGALPGAVSGAKRPLPGSKPGNWMDLSLDTYVREVEETAQTVARPAPPHPPPARSIAPPSMFEDEEFRRYRVGRLLDLAGAAR